MMKPSNSLVWLSSLIVLLVLFAASMGLFWQKGDSSFSFTILLSILPALLQGKAPPEVGSYTTVITYVIDIGIIAPTLIGAGVMLLRRTPLGYLLASVLLVFIAILGINLLAAGTVQMFAGLIRIGQFIGFVMSFAILILFAIGLP